MKEAGIANKQTIDYSVTNWFWSVSYIKEKEWHEENSEEIKLDRDVGERGQRERGRQEGLSEEVTFQLGSKEWVGIKPSEGLGITDSRQKGHLA